MGFIIPAAAILAAKAGKAYFGSKAKKKQNDAQRTADVSALTIEQKQREDARRARVDAGASLLNGVPGTTAGGGVNTGVSLDPELVKRLGLERTYDFKSAVADRNAGAGSAFLSGLFGDVGDTVAGMYGGGMGGGATAAWQDVSRGGANPWANGTTTLPGGGPQTAPLHMVDGGAAPTLSWEDLMRRVGGGDSGF